MRSAAVPVSGVDWADIRASPSGWRLIEVVPVRWLRGLAWPRLSRPIPGCERIWALALETRGVQPLRPAATDRNTLAVPLERW